MKKAIVTLVIVAAVAGAGYGLYRTGKLQTFTHDYLGKVIPALSREEETENAEGRVSSTDPNAVYLDSVRTLANLGSGDGLIEKFSGKVEPQETKKYSIASGRKVTETYVQEGDEVKKGDKLFRYDTESMKDKLEQAKIDLERLQNSVDVSEAKAKELEKQLASANTPEKKLQALEEQNNLKQQKLELKSKQAKIDSINEQIENSTVTSDIDGVVKTINENAASGDLDSQDYSTDSGNSSAYITLLKVGTYRIKASCNEQNIGSIYVGEQVLVHSRVDASTIWKGAISQIKTDQGSDSSAGSNSGYPDQDSSGSGSTNYPFYVELDSSDGLMLGQHVYIEQDLGQADRKPGIWLDDYYFVRDSDGSAYVWAASDDNTLEKRKVELGEEDKDQQKTEVKSGLGADDYICQPSDSLKEGMPVAYNDDTAAGEVSLNEEGTSETETLPEGVIGGVGSPFIGGGANLDLSGTESGTEGTEVYDADSEETEVPMVPIDQSSEAQAADDSANSDGIN